MGFSHEASSVVLTATDGDLNEAAELLTQQQQQQRQQSQESQAALIPADNTL